MEMPEGKVINQTLSDIKSDWKFFPQVFIKCYT